MLYLSDDEFQQVDENDKCIVPLWFTRWLYVHCSCLPSLIVTNVAAAFRIDIDRSIPVFNLLNLKLYFYYERS